MTRIVRFPVLTGALAIACCLATLGPLTSKEAAAQVILAPSNPQPYYNSYGAGYNSPYQHGYVQYGAVNSGYTVYGNGPYVYGSSGVFGNSIPGVVYGASYGPDTRGTLYGGQPYPRAYAPSNVRYYSPYGYQSPYGLQNPYGYQTYGYRRF